MVGCDDIFAASTTSPPLTTITTHGLRRAWAETGLLIGRLTPKVTPGRTERILTHLTVRASTGLARA